MLKAFAALTIFLVCSFATDRLATANKDNIEVVKASGKGLNDAFVAEPMRLLRELTAPGHVAVSPSYRRPMNTQEQLDTLAEIKLKMLSSSEAKITVLGPNAALLQQEQRYSGTFGDTPVPNRV